MKNIEQIWIITQAIFRATWWSTIKIVGSLIMILLFLGLMDNIEIGIPLISVLLELSIGLMDNWFIFWGVFFFSDLYFKLRGEIFNQW